jgi:hypothetical protein
MNERACAECGTPDASFSYTEGRYLCGACYHGLPNGAALLDDIAAFVRRYVVLTPDQASATALWVVHSYAIDAADCTPYLHVTSPEKKSGKTRLLEVLDLLANLPWFTGSVSAAVLRRRLELDHPALLLDETDAVFKKESEYSEALRAILDAGHRRGCLAWLCVGKGHELASFDVFGPKALAGIGKLPDTIADRSIRIALRRRAPNEPATRFRRREVEEEAKPLRERVERWAAAYLEALKAARPDLPDFKDDRAADGWEPLLAIADAVGGDWPQRARQSALALTGGDVRDDDSLGVKLLADIYTIFQERETDRLSSTELVAALNAIEESPWGDLRGKPFDTRRLAHRLRPFEVTPHQVRFADQTLKGYEAVAFADPWERYLPLCMSVGRETRETEPAARLNLEPESVSDVSDVSVNTGIQEDVGEPPLSRERCPACGSTERWFRPDGSGPVCARCHPNPAMLVLAYQGAGI